jgi:hypothetical protein
MSTSVYDSWWCAQTPLLSSPTHPRWLHLRKNATVPSSNFHLTTSTLLVFSLLLIHHFPTTTTKLFNRPQTTTSMIFKTPSFRVLGWHAIPVRLSLILFKTNALTSNRIFIDSMLDSINPSPYSPFNSLFQYLFIQFSNFTFTVNVLFSVFRDFHFIKFLVIICVVY